MPRSATQLDAGKRGLNMNFDHEELTLMMLYNTGTRLGLIHELRLMQCYLMPDETALRELSEGVIEKSKLLTDAEFAELEFPARSGLTGFLALHFTRIAGQEPVLLHHTAPLGIDFDEGACDAQTCSLSLPVDTAAREVDGNVIAFRVLEHQKGLFHHVLKDIQRKVCFHGFVVYGNGSFTGLHVNACNGSFPTSYGVYNFHSFYLISFNLIVLGFCAVCGCSAPA